MKKTKRKHHGITKKIAWIMVVAGGFVISHLRISFLPVNMATYLFQQTNDRPTSRSTTTSTNDTNTNARARSAVFAEKPAPTPEPSLSDSTKNLDLNTTSLALCHPTLFGTPNLHQLLHFISYYRQLGVDHFYFWHLPCIRDLPQFDQLAALRYVTLTQHTAAGGSNYYQQAEVQAECLATAAGVYDWVLVVDADEFVWFGGGDNSFVDAKTFLHMYAQFNFLALAKWEYSRHFSIATNNNNTNSNPFGLAQFPFTAKSYCLESPHPPNHRGCPGWKGRCKFLVRPDTMPLNERKVVHGRIKKQTPPALFVPAHVAHIKEFYGILLVHQQSSMNNNTAFQEQRPPESFRVDSMDFERVGLPQLNRAYAVTTYDNGTAEVTMHYDASLIQWLTFVQQLSVPEDDTTAGTLGNDTTATASTLFPRLSSGGVVHYKTARYSGWNNQRQSAMAAWVVAYCTGHTLQFKPYHPAITGVQRVQPGVITSSGAANQEYQHGELWDLSALQKHVQVQLIPYNQTGDGYDYDLDIERQFHSLGEMTEELLKYHSITYTSAWAFLQHQLPWLDPFSTDVEYARVVFERMMESFKYVAEIHQLADRVIEHAFHDRPFIALHIRKDRLPALDCGALQLNNIVDTRPRFLYQNGGCEGITWEDVVQQRLFADSDPLNNMPVYIAQDGSFDGFVNSGSIQHNVTTVAYIPFLSQLRPAVVSAVEQVVASRAEYFVASTHSSWSEYVIYQRVIDDKKDAKKNYQVWVKNLRLIHPLLQAKT